MVYRQYSIYANTGGAESLKNRIPSNAHDAAQAEHVGFPDKFDLFVNKENSSENAYAVTEVHTTSEIVGSTLFLDHRPFVDTDGSVSTITSSDGTIDMTQLNLVTSSVVFSVMPTDETIQVSYTAAGDKIWDSHLNAVQNTLMRIESSLGLRNPAGSVPTGLFSLPIATTYNPGAQVDIDYIKNVVLPNVVMLGHLESDIKLGGTDNVALDSYGNPGYNITIGNPAGGTAARDHVYIDAPGLHVNASTGPGNLFYSCNSGDNVGFSGVTTFASQVTIGDKHGGSLSRHVPQPAGILGDFYDHAMLRVNGSIYFGDGMSGYGGITFVVGTGEVVDIIGTLDVDTIDCNDYAMFHGPATFEDHTHVVGPGYFETNNDMVLTDKAPYVPTMIDDLDPSYALTHINVRSTVPGTVTSPLYAQTFSTARENPYPSGRYTHPIHDYDMYPMIGGWTFTGHLKFDVAAENDHKTVLLCSTNMRALKPGATDEYGTYCPGLFSPGDTYVEVNNGGADRFMYPIYFHQALTGNDLVSTWTCTGLNLYVAGDDNIMENAIAGSQYRILQPSNAPMDFLKAGGTTNAPTVEVGVDSAGYYGSSSQNTFDFVTHPTHEGPSAGPTPHPLYRSIKNNQILSASIKEALQRNVDHTAILAAGGYTEAVLGAPKATINGVAYIYASSHNQHGTISDAVTIKASPSPYGVCTANTWAGGLNLNPGQWTIIGEIAAVTADGNDWSIIEAVGYRPDGLYDSCWVPLVNFRDFTEHEAVVLNMGRCLPFYGSDHGGSDVYDAAEGDHNFFVEHNLGPIRNLADISFNAYVGSLKSHIYTSPDKRWAAKHQLSATAASVYGGLNSPYRSAHDSYRNDLEGHADWDTNGRGYLRDVTSQCKIAMFDSRFARIYVNDEQDPGVSFVEPDATRAEYIRIVFRRNR